MEYLGIIKIKQIDEPLKIINGNELDSAVENMLKCDIQLRVKKRLLPDDENMYTQTRRKVTFAKCYICAESYIFSFLRVSILRNFRAAGPFDARRSSIVFFQFNKYILCWGTPVVRGQSLSLESAISVLGLPFFTIAVRFNLQLQVRHGEEAQSL